MAKICGRQSCGVWIRIQGFYDQKTEEKNYTAEIFKNLILIKNCNLLLSKLQKKPLALKREHIQQIINFFLCFCVIFALLDPDTDPGTPFLNPDPQHWWQQVGQIRYPGTHQLGGDAQGWGSLCGRGGRRSPAGRTRGGRPARPPPAGTSRRQARPPSSSPALRSQPSAVWRFSRVVLASPAKKRFLMRAPYWEMYSY